MSPDIAQKVATFFSKYPERQFQGKHLLLQPGETLQAIHYLVHGRVRQYDITPKGDETVVNVFKQHAFFPVSLAVNDTPNDYFYEALDGITVRSAPVPVVLTFLHDNPDVVFDLLRRVYSGVDGLLRRQAQLMGGTAISRLSFELLIACRRFGRTLDTGDCFVDVKEMDFATRTGLTRETVSRCLQRLKTMGCLDVVRGGVVVKDVTILEREVNLDPELGSATR
jgi:CRP-like cAMP-binding protein